MLNISRVQPRRLARTPAIRPVVKAKDNMPMSTVELQAKAYALFRGLSEPTQKLILAKIAAELGFQL